MTSATTNPFRVDIRDTQQGFRSNRVVISKDNLWGLNAPILAIDRDELPGLLSALQSFAYNLGKGDCQQLEHP